MSYRQIEKEVVCFRTRCAISGPIHLALFLLAFWLGFWQSSHCAQLDSPAVAWQTNYGGRYSDYLSCLEQTKDGGFILAGDSTSPPSCNKSSTNYGGSDAWVVRLDSKGTKIWDRSFGGTNVDHLNSVKQTLDGGYIACGWSLSGVDGNKTSPNRGRADAWLVRLDTQGHKLWDKSYGGTSNEMFTAVQPIPDGGYFVGGISFSGASGNKKSPNFGASDYWVMKLDKEGKIIWDRSFGGDDFDKLAALQLMADGGIILAGTSRSGISGNKSSPAGYGDDFWVLRLDSKGNKIWDRTFDFGDDRCYAIGATHDGGVIVGGTSNGFLDLYPHIWVLRLDSNGNELWDRHFRGIQDLSYNPSEDDLYALCPTADGGFLLGGTSTTGPGADKTGPNLGGFDAWILRLDSDGNVIWQQTYGGQDSDQVSAVQQTYDGGFIIGGASNSGITRTGDCETLLRPTFWVFKLQPEPVRLVSLPQSFENIRDEGFRFALTGTSNFYVTDFSTNCRDWTPLQTNRLTIGGGTLTIRDAEHRAVSQRFYRSRAVRQVP